MTDQDEAAFREFVTTRAPALLRLARLLVGEHSAPDLLQDALTRLVPRWHDVRDPEAYVRTSLHRGAISRWRRRRDVPVDLSDGDPTDAGASWLTAPRRTAFEQSSTDRLVLRAALARLTPRQRTVLVARHVEDLSEAQTAELLGISVGAVRSTNHRALARLREVAPELADFAPPMAAPRAAVAPSRTDPEVAR